MIDIKGISINTFPISDLNLVGVLLYHNFPSTIVYSDKDGNPIIVEWVDCTDDRKTHRYLAYQTTIKSLTNYIQGTWSHHKLIKSSVDNIIYSFDGEIDDVLNPKIIPFSSIPASYLPKQDVYFNSNEEVELDDVLEFFNIAIDRKSALQIYESPELASLSYSHKVIETDSYSKHLQYTQKDLLKIVADKEDSEVINLHIKEGDKVGYGTADTFVLGRLLTTVDDLYRETALDYVEGVDRDNLRSITSKRGQLLYNRISTRVVLNEAASYSVFLKPIEKENAAFEGDDTSVFKRIFSLFNGSGDNIDLMAIKDSFSPYVYKAYQEFLEVIKLSEVDLECNFYNPLNGDTIDQEFKPEKAATLLENIKHLTTSQIEKVNVVARFQALNCTTGHYTLRFDDNKEEKGHFDYLIKPSMPSLNFTSYYNITISREKINSSGKRKAKIEDTIISCIKIDV